MKKRKTVWREPLADLAKNLEPVSINGRVAFGITCLEIMCSHWQISGASVQALLDKMWEFTESNRLDLWEEEVLEYCPGSPVPDEEDADCFGLHHLPDEKQKAFCEMVYKVCEIGTANLYGGFRSEFSMEPALSGTDAGTRTPAP
jgi:hypothetical protein